MSRKQMMREALCLRGVECNAQKLSTIYEEEARIAAHRASRLESVLDIEPQDAKGNYLALAEEQERREKRRRRAVRLKKEN